MGRVSAIVLAAGFSRRMGIDKLSLPWGDGTVLDAALRPFLALPEIDEVIVVVRLGPAPGLAPSRATVLVNESADEGMGSSLRAGVRGANPEAEAYILALGDMPLLGSDLVAHLLATWRSSGKGILVPVYRASRDFLPASPWGTGGRCACPSASIDGRRGHPVVIAGRYRDALLASSGDVGARRLLADNEWDIEPCEVTDPAVVTDIDTCEGYQKLAANRGTR
ncbi:MAG TPA: nucleotidyltransferase family protein [Thermoanaerobaculaceae bacterium]|nr:nucleotidyltransferase family protein [Thermoanaerobaculaceae bacterium]HPS77858.1 nucleotidyltransferase family protein [Thermoanaerobaculaceae bacterium]